MKKPLSGFLKEKRADTRGGLSKGLGAFRIGRPLGPDNRCAEKPFPAPQKNLQATGCGKLFTRRGDLGGMPVGGTEHHDQQQRAGNQGFQRMFKDEGRNTHMRWLPSKNLAC
jgi:hypothetical protein